MIIRQILGTAGLLAAAVASTAAAGASIGYCANLYNAYVELHNNVGCGATVGGFIGIALIEVAVLCLLFKAGAWLWNLYDE